MQSGVRNRWLACGAFVIWCAQAHALTFTPEEAAVSAIRNNKDLIAARFLIAEAEARLVQAGLWSNPMLQMAGESDGNGDEGDYEVSAGFMQRFPLARRLAKAREVSRVDVAMAIYELHDRERMLAGEVLGRARARLIVDRRVAINDENRAVLDRMLDQAMSLVAAGKAGAADPRLIELEQTTLALQRDTLLVEGRAIVADLNRLLGLDATTALTISGDLPTVPSQEILVEAKRAALERRPDRRLALLQIDRTRAEEVLARAEKWEDLIVGLEVLNEQMEHMEATMVGLQVSVPLPLWNRNQGRVAEAQAAQQRAAAALEGRELAILTEIQEAEARLTGFADVVRRTRGQAVELARRNTQLLEETYAAGSTPFLTVFESRRQRLNVQQSAVEIEERFAAALSEWEMRTVHFPPQVRAALGTNAVAKFK